MESKRPSVDDQPSLSPTRATLGPRDEDLEEVMALLEPRERESHPAGPGADYEFSREFFLEDGSSPCPDTNKDPDTGKKPTWLCNNGWVLRGRPFLFLT